MAKSNNSIIESRAIAELCTIKFISKYFHDLDEKKTYEELTAHFRMNWDYGQKEDIDTKRYFNLLVSFFREINSILTISNIIKIIMNENEDLGGITRSKLVDNLNLNYKVLYRKGL